MLPAGKTVIQWLSSTQLSLILFGLLAAAALPGTLLKSQQGYYTHPLFVLLLAAFDPLVFCHQAVAQPGADHPGRSCRVLVVLAAPFSLPPVS
jgi:hypothetical protein